MWEPSALTARQALDSGWAAVRARTHIMVGVPLLAAVLVVVLNVSAPHEARLVLAFPSPDRTGALASLGVPGQPAPLPQQLLADGLLNRMVVERLTDGPETPDSLRTKLRVEGGSGPQTSTLVASGASDAQAADLTQGWGTAITRTRGDTLTFQFQSVRATLRELRRGRRARRRGKAGSLARREIDRRLAQLLAAQSTIPATTQVLQAPMGAPRVNLRNEFLALVGGTLLAALICLLLELRDPRLRSRSAAEASFGHPVLGAVDPRPLGENGEDRPEREPDEEAAAVVASKVLSILGSANGSRRAGVLAVTCTAQVPDPPGTIVGLAEALARRGAPLGLVIWRDPELADRMELDEDTRRRGDLLLLRHDGPAEGLAERVAAVRERAEVVLVLVPPVGSVPSALLADQVVDGWLIVAALGGTRVEEARHVRAELEALGEHSVGVVMAADPEPPDA